MSLHPLSPFRLDRCFVEFEFSQEYATTGIFEVPFERKGKTLKPQCFTMKEKL